MGKTTQIWSEVKYSLKEVNYISVNFPKRRIDPGAGDKEMNLSLE